MANEKVATFTDLERAQIRVAINMKVKSIERLMKNETSTEVLKLRTKEIEQHREITNKL